MYPESDTRSVPHPFCTLRTPSFSHIPEEGFHKPWMPWPSQILKIHIPPSRFGPRTSEDAFFSHAPAFPSLGISSQRPTASKNSHRSRRKVRTSRSSRNEDLDMLSPDHSMLESSPSAPHLGPSKISTIFPTDPMELLASVCDAVTTQRRSGPLRQEMFNGEQSSTFPAQTFPDIISHDSTKPTGHNGMQSSPASSPPEVLSQRPHPRKVHKSTVNSTIHQTIASSSTVVHRSGTVSTIPDGSPSSSGTRDAEDEALRVSKRRRTPTKRAQDAILAQKERARRQAARTRKHSADSFVPSSSISGSSPATPRRSRVRPNKPALDAKHDNEADSSPTTRTSARLESNRNRLAQKKRMV